MEYEQNGNAQGMRALNESEVNCVSGATINLKYAAVSVEYRDVIRRLYSDLNLPYPQPTS